MNVVFINNSLETFTPTQSGALATVIWECCRVAEREGDHPVVVTRRCDAAPFAWEHVRFIDPPTPPRSPAMTMLWRAERRLTGWRHLRHRGYARRVVRSVADLVAGSATLVLINEPEMAVTLRRAFPKARIVHWFQNQLECKPKFRAAFNAAADVVLGVSEYTSRWVEGYYGLTAGRVATVYNGVDAEQFAPASKPSAGPPVIGFVGRTGIEKAPDLLLQAAVRMMEAGLQFRIQLIGSNHWDRFEIDDYQRRLAQLAEHLRAGGIEVRCPGHVGRSDLPNELRHASVHVVPSRWDEPFGLTTLEGMASGLAVVASRTGGTPEVLGDAGLYFERDAVGELTDRLTGLVQSPAELDRLRSAARRRATKFSWARVWHCLNDICRVG